MISFCLDYFSSRISSVPHIYKYYIILIECFCSFSLSFPNTVHLIGEFIDSSERALLNVRDNNY